MSDPIMPPSSPLGYESTGTLTEADPGQRTQAMVAHLLGILGILGTGIYYLVKKNDPTVGPFVRDQMKEVFNWELFLTVVIVVLYVIATIIIVVTHSAILAGLLSLLSLIVTVGNWVLVIMNAMKANKGIAARYPYKLAVLK